MKRQRRKKCIVINNRQEIISPLVKWVTAKDTKAVTNKKYGRVFGYMQNTTNIFSEAR